MKKLLFFFVGLAILSSCSKNEDQTEPLVQENSEKVQYPHDYYKAKFDDIDNPVVEKVNILVDLTANTNNAKDVTVNGYISHIAFKWSTWDHNSPLYHHCANFPGRPDPQYEDLNQDAGGKYIYFYYITSSNRADGISDLWVTMGSTMYSAITDYSCLDGDSPYYEGGPFEYADLNRGAGGKYICANVRKNYSSRRMVGLGTIRGNSSAIQAPAGWEKIAGDLNKGAGGKYIYFIVKWV